MNRRILLLWPFAAPLLLSLLSCQHTPRSVAGPLDEARERFAAVQPGMTKTAAKRRLGAPLEPGNPALWERRHDAVNFETVRVTFTGGGKVKEAEWESGRGSDRGIYRWQNLDVWKASAAHPRWLSSRSVSRRWSIPPGAGISGKKKSSYLPPGSAGPAPEKAVPQQPPPP